jgi:hypothetical protein
LGEAINNPDFNRANAIASIETASEGIALCKIWLSAVGALVIFTFSGTFLALDRLANLGGWQRGILFFLMFLELFQVFIVSRIAENLTTYIGACRRYLATPCTLNDPLAKSAMAEVDKAKAISGGPYFTAAITGILLLFTLLAVYGVMIFAL